MGTGVVREVVGVACGTLCTGTRRMGIVKALAKPSGFQRATRLVIGYPHIVKLLVCWLFVWQGFSVSNVSETYDAKVFAASTMLSSLLLYNSM